MIRRLRHNEIDFEKYDECVIKSKQYRIYAESWYLEAVSDKKWDCFIYGDYEAVMPIPYQKKLGVKFIIQPLFCQQLGVFSKKDLDQELFDQFKKKLSKFWVRSYCLNEENTRFFTPKGSLKNNFLLELNKTYNELENCFKRDRKKDIRRIEKTSLKIEYNFDFELFQNELVSNYPHLTKFYKSAIFQNLVHELQNRKRIHYSELRKNEQIISTLLIADSGIRKIVLFSTRNSNNQYKGAFTYLINDYIKENSNQKIILDFEGSMIPGVANFNESLGASNHYYTCFSTI